MPSTIELEDRADALLRELDYLDAWVLVNALTKKLNHLRSGEGRPFMDSQGTFPVANVHTLTTKQASSL